MTFTSVYSGDPTTLKVPAVIEPSRHFGLTEHRNGGCSEERSEHHARGEGSTHDCTLPEMLVAFDHVVGHELADDAVRERVISNIDCQISELMIFPEPFEVLQDYLLSGRIIGDPVSDGWAAGLQLNVVKIRNWVDARPSTLALETRRNEIHDRTRSCRRQHRWRHNGLTADRIGCGGERVGADGPQHLRVSTARTEQRERNGQRAEDRDRTIPHRNLPTDYDALSRVVAVSQSDAIIATADLASASS